MNFLSENARLINDDCLVAMRSLGDQSVDMILCDLPYGTVNWKSPHEWDNIIPLKPMWEQYWRLLKPRAAIILFGNEPFSTLLKNSQIQHFKYDYVWKKSIAGGFANAKVKPLKYYETISVFSKGTTSPGRHNNMAYYPQGLVRIDKKVKTSGKSRIGFTVREDVEYVQEYTNYPGDILDFDNETGLHPTQKPVPLLRRLIRTYSLVGETVLDNTMGSGSTGVAAVLEGRKFIGIEQDQNYFNIAVDRISKLAPNSVPETVETTDPVVTDDIFRF